MSVTNQSNLQREERVALEVQRFICLYDKSDPGYKEREIVANAWKEVDEALGLEPGE